MYTFVACIHLLHVYIVLLPVDDVAYIHLLHKYIVLLPVDDVACRQYCLQVT